MFRTTSTPDHNFRARGLVLYFPVSRRALRSLVGRSRDRLIPTASSQALVIAARKAGH